MEYERPAKIHDSGFLSAVVKFMRQKGELLAQQCPSGDVPRPCETAGEHLLTAAGSSLVPLESRMGLSVDIRRQHFHQSVAVNDMVIGMVTTVWNHGMLGTLLCTDTPDIQRDIDDLDITVFCPSEELPQTISNPARVEALHPRDLFRGVVVEVDRGEQRITVSLRGRGEDPHLQETSRSCMGLITADDLPAYYRRHKEDGNSRGTKQGGQRGLGTSTAQCVSALQSYLGLSHRASLFTPLHRAGTPEEEHAERLSQVQVDCQAARSTARGKEMLREGRGQEALEHFNKALTADPYYAEALVTRGVLHADSTCYFEAVGDFEMALENDPSHRTARILLTETKLVHALRLEEDQMLVEAEEVFQEILDADPGCEHARLGSERCRLRLRDQSSSAQPTALMSPEFEWSEEEQMRTEYWRHLLEKKIARLKKLTQAEIDGWLDPDSSRAEKGMRSTRPLSPPRCGSPSPPPSPHTDLQQLWEEWQAKHRGQRSRLSTGQPRRHSGRSDMGEFVPPDSSSRSGGHPRSSHSPTRNCSGTAGPPVYVWPSGCRDYTLSVNGSRSSRRSEFSHIHGSRDSGSDHPPRSAEGATARDHSVSTGARSGDAPLECHAVTSQRGVERGSGVTPNWWDDLSSYLGVNWAVLDRVMKGCDLQDPQDTNNNQRHRPSPQHARERRKPYGEGLLDRTENYREQDLRFRPHRHRPQADLSPRGAARGEFRQRRTRDAADSVYNSYREALDKAYDGGHRSSRGGPYAEGRCSAGNSSGEFPERGHREEVGRREHSNSWADSSYHTNTKSNVGNTDCRNREKCDNNRERSHSRTSSSNKRWCKYRDSADNREIDRNRAEHTAERNGKRDGRKREDERTCVKIDGHGRKREWRSREKHSTERRNRESSRNHGEREVRTTESSQKERRGSDRKREERRGDGGDSQRRKSQVGSKENKSSDVVRRSIRDRHTRTSSQHAHSARHSQQHTDQRQQVDWEGSPDNIPPKASDGSEECSGKLSCRQGEEEDDGVEPALILTKGMVGVASRWDSPARSPHRHPSDNDGYLGDVNAASFAVHVTDSVGLVDIDDDSVGEEGQETLKEGEQKDEVGHDAESDAPDLPKVEDLPDQEWGTSSRIDSRIFMDQQIADSDSTDVEPEAVTDPQGKERDGKSPAGGEVCTQKSSAALKKDIVRSMSLADLEKTLVRQVTLLLLPDGQKGRQQRGEDDTEMAGKEDAQMTLEMKDGAESQSCSSDRNRGGPVRRERWGWRGDKHQPELGQQKMDSIPPKRPCRDCFGEAKLPFGPVPEEYIHCSPHAWEKTGRDGAGDRKDGEEADASLGRERIISNFVVSSDNSSSDSGMSDSEGDDLAPDSSPASWSLVPEHSTSSTCRKRKSNDRGPVPGKKPVRGSSSDSSVSSVRGRKKQDRKRKPLKSRSDNRPVVRVTPWKIFQMHTVSRRWRKGVKMTS